MTIYTVSFLWKCCCAKSQWHLCCVLAQTVPNQWPWCGGTGGFGCSAQSRGLCAGTNCALQTVSLPGTGVLNIWYLVFFGAFSVSGTTECLLTLSFLCLLSMHGPLRVLAPGTPNFAPEWAETVTFLFFQDNGSHLIPEKVLGLFLSASFSLTEKGPQDWYFSSSNIGAIMKTALHVSVPNWHCMKTNTGVLWQHAAHLSPP